MKLRVENLFIYLIIVIINSDLTVMGDDKLIKGAREWSFMPEYNNILKNKV